MCLICQKVNIMQSDFQLGCCVGSQLEYHQPQQQGVVVVTPMKKKVKEARMKMKEEER